MGGGGGGTTTSNMRSEKPDVYIPVAPTRTIAENPDTLKDSLFTEGVSLSKEEIAKKISPTSRLVIPLDNSKATSVGGTPKPRTPTGVV